MYNEKAKYRKLTKQNIGILIVQMRKQKYFNEAPVDALGDKQRVHGLELREPLLHLVGNLPNANLEIVISFGFVFY